MKLEDLLGKYLVSWPSGAEYLWQGSSGMVYDELSNDKFYTKERAEDWSDAKVTMDQYIAARDRLAVSSLKEMANKEAKKTSIEKSMWLEIAKDQFHIMTKDKEYREMTHEQLAEFAFDAADAFCAEMNKRI